MSLLEGRILVTGGAGFIGSALVWALNRRGHERIVIADFPPTPEKARNLRPLRYEAFVDAAGLRRGLARSPGAFGSFAAVFHLGLLLDDRDRPCLPARQQLRVHPRAGRLVPRSGVPLRLRSSAATYGTGAGHGRP